MKEQEKQSFRGFNLTDKQMKGLKEYAIKNGFSTASNGLRLLISKYC